MRHICQDLIDSLDCVLKGVKKYKLKCHIPAIANSHFIQHVSQGSEKLMGTRFLVSLSYINIEKMFRK